MLSQAHRVVPDTINLYRCWLELCDVPVLELIRHPDPFVSAPLQEAMHCMLYNYTVLCRKQFTILSSRAVFSAERRDNVKTKVTRVLMCSGALFRMSKICPQAQSLRTLSLSFTNLSYKHCTKSITVTDIFNNNSHCVTGRTLEAWATIAQAVHMVSTLTACNHKPKYQY